MLSVSSCCYTVYSRGYLWFCLNAKWAKICWQNTTLGDQMCGRPLRSSVLLCLHSLVLLLYRRLMRWNLGTANEWLLKVANVLVSFIIRTRMAAILASWPMALERWAICMCLLLLCICEKTVSSIYSRGGSGRFRLAIMIMWERGASEQISITGTRLWFLRFTIIY